MPRMVIGLVFFILFSFNFKPSLAIFDKDSGLPIPLMVDLLELESLNLSTLESYYLYFDLVRKALHYKGAITRESASRMVDAYVACLVEADQDHPQKPKEIWVRLKTFYKELNALHFFMRRGVGFYQTSMGQKLYLITDQHLVTIGECLGSLLHRYHNLNVDVTGRLTTYQRKMYAEIFLTSLLLTNSLVTTGRIVLQLIPAERQRTAQAIIDQLVHRLYEQVNVGTFGTEYRPLFYYLRESGVTERLKFIAHQYFISIYPNPKSYNAALTFAAAHVQSSPKLVGDLLTQLIKCSEDLIESIGKINERIDDIAIQSRVSQAINQRLDIEEKSARKRKC